MKRIASSFTTDSEAGVTSVHVAVGGLFVSSNVTFETWVPAMYMAAPVFQSSPSEGSPAFVRMRTSDVW